ncbi:hypothetical protein B0H17DRAFT_1129058 [Mycena rosella]|uniref:Uncharacterized protein n=1 Tax=Mycena rosella TaxID=1033263 RepID=A0AAD7GLA3_MYCRO|nr:hypothetical protein B0H17DRAFT_1129058 [Mycena rosella]
MAVPAAARQSLEEDEPTAAVTFHGGNVEVLRPRPGGGGREAKTGAPPPKAPPKAPPGQTRAMCPKRPQFCASLSTPRHTHTLPRHSRSTSGHHPAAEFSSWGTPLECARHHRMSSIAWQKRCEATDTPKIHGQAAGNYSRDVGLKSNSLQYDRLKADEKKNGGAIWRERTVSALKATF